MANEEVFGARETSLLERDMLGDTTHLGDNLGDDGRQRDIIRRAGKQTRARWRTAVSLSQLLRSSVSWSECLRTQSAPIPIMSHLLHLLFSDTTESYLEPLSPILHFRAPASQRGHPRALIEMPHTERWLKVDRLQFSKKREGGIESPCLES